MLMRFDPFREFDRITQQMWSGSRPAVMPMDAYRRGDQFAIHFDLPGVAPGSIDLTVEKNVLTVNAERNWQAGEGCQVVASERPHGKFSRQLFLGEGLDYDHIAAGYEHGVLTVTIPVAQAAKPRKVEIQAGNSAQKAITVEAEQPAAEAGQPAMANA